MDSEKKARKKVEPWHCPQAYKRPVSEICPECLKRRREEWKDRSWEAYRKAREAKLAATAGSDVSSPEAPA